MPIDPPNLGNPKPGQPITALWHRRINQVAKNQYNANQRGGMFVGGLGMMLRPTVAIAENEVVPGIIANTSPPPTKSAFTTDARYWVRLVDKGDLPSQKLKPVQTTNTQDVSEELLDSMDPTTGTVVHVAATNLAEKFLTSSGGSHLLDDGEPVLLWEAVFLNDAAERERHWVFWRVPRPLFVPVECEVDGGVAGDDTTDCSFTYAVIDLNNGLTIATGATPDRRRLEKTTHKTESSNGANDDTSKAWAYFETDGSFILVWPWNELPVTATCD